MAHKRLSFTNVNQEKTTKIWENRICQHGVLKSLGAFKLKNVRNDFYIFPTQEWEHEVMTFVDIKPNEKVFRYETETTKAGGIMPLIKINLESGLVYFMSESNEEENTITFESRSEKPLWINLSHTVKE